MIFGAAFFRTLFCIGKFSVQEKSPDSTDIIVHPRVGKVRAVRPRAWPWTSHVAFERHELTCVAVMRNHVQSGYRPKELHKHLLIQVSLNCSCPGLIQHLMEYLGISPL